MVFSYFYGSTNPFVHRVCHVNSFQAVCFFSSGSNHFNIRKIISRFPNLVRFIRPQVAFVSRPPTLFLQGPRFLNQVSIYSCEVSFTLFNQCSYPVIIMKLARNFKFVILCYFLLRWIQFKLSVLIISLSLFQMFFHVGAPLNCSPLSILIRSAQDISEESSSHS